MKQEDTRDFRVDDSVIICKPKEVIVLWPGHRRFQPKLGYHGWVVAIHSATMDIWFEVPYRVPGTEDEVEQDEVLVRVRRVRHEPEHSCIQLVGSFPELAARHEDYPWLHATFLGEPNEIPNRRMRTKL